MEYLILKLLDFIYVAKVLRVGLHLPRWFGIFVDQPVFESLLFCLELEYARIDVLDFFLREQDLVVSLLNLSFKSLKIALVLLFNFPVLELAASFASSPSRA